MINGEAVTVTQTTTMGADGVPETLTERIVRKSDGTVQRFVEDSRPQQLEQHQPPVASLRASIPQEFAAHEEQPDVIEPNTDGKVMRSTLENGANTVRRKSAKSDARTETSAETSVELETDSTSPRSTTTEDGRIETEARSPRGKRKNDTSSTIRPLKAQKTA
jgi:hypothetical protein